MNISPDYVTGFSEGEAAFTFCTTKLGRPVPRFSFRQTWQGRDVLEQLQAFFKVGKIYECKARGRTATSCYYMVTNVDDLPVIVDHFDRFPLLGLQKRKVFKVWSVLVDAHLKRADKATLVKVAAQLTALQLRPRGRFGS